MNLEVLVLFVVMVLYHEVSGHGYVIQPPQRSSAWRLGYDVPPNYTDNELSCGGAGVQWNSVNDGRCGVCGDPYQATVKENEDIGGKYVTGTITGHYVSGGAMEVKVNITAYHKGWFEFRLCPLENSATKVTQACLNQTLLHEVATGKERFLLEQMKTTSTGSEVYTMSLQLPSYTCDNCVLQWWYNTGNSWGCEEVGCGIGYGKQERFVNCADIRIHGNNVDNDSSMNSESTTQRRSTAAKSATLSVITSTLSEMTSATSKHITSTSADSSPQSSTTTVENEECSCVAVAPYDENPGMPEWCCSNCPANCPSSICACS